MPRQYKQFVCDVNAAILQTEITESVYYFGHTISLDEANNVYIDGMVYEGNSIDDGKLLVDNKIIENQVSNQLQSYDTNVIVEAVINAAKQHNNIRLTNTIVSNYIEILESKQFTIDPVVLSVKQQSLVEGRYDYILDDGNTVVISEQLQDTINNIFQDYPDVINYMRSSVDNFLNVIDQLEG